MKRYCRMKQNAAKGTSTEKGRHKNIITLPSNMARKDTKVKGSTATRSDGQRVLAQKFSEQWTTPVSGATGYSVGNVYPNPGDSSVFSRLSSLAACYTEYRYKTFRLKYLPLGSAFATNNNSGEVVLSAVGNFYTSPPSSMQGARAITPNVAGDAWVESELHVTQDILGKWRKVRSNVATSGADANSFDFVLMVSVQATNNTNSIGYLLFDGEVEFRGDYYQNVAFPPRTNMVWSMWQPNSQNLAASGGTYVLTTSGATICYGQALTGVVVQSNTFYLYGGTYCVIVRCNFTATGGTSAALTCQNVTNMYFSNQPTSANNSWSFTTMQMCETYTMAVVEDGAPGTFNLAATMYGASALNVVNWAITILALG